MSRNENLVYENGSVYEGVVKSTRDDTPKNYWFVKCPGYPDVFVHFSAIRSEGHKKLTEGQSVQFAAELGDRGWKATECIPL